MRKQPLSGWARLYLVWAGLWFWAGLYAMAYATRSAERINIGDAMVLAILVVPVAFLTIRWVVRGFRNGAV